MMAAIAAPRTAAPALWLALPREGALPQRRARAGEQRLRDALLARMQREGLAATRGAGLSHSGGHVACAVAAGGVAGVDLEWHPPRRAQAVAGFAYSPGEAATLAALPEASCGEAFLDLWVLKEAAAKALGLPLLTALARCCFVVAGGRIVAQWPDASLSWSAWLYAPRPGLRLAWLGVGSSAGLEPLCMEWIADVDELRTAQWPLIARGIGDGRG
jgi:hypothetical protein